jgi:hypothetical protein
VGQGRGARTSGRVCSSSRRGPALLLAHALRQGAFPTH